MKKIIIILVISLSVYNCKAQVISLEEANTYFLSEDEGLPDHITGVKDINNTLDEFLGVWTLDYNSKHYELTITKFESMLATIKIDILLIKHKITDNNGVVLDDTTNLPNKSPSVMNGQFFLNDNESYLVSYLGPNTKCGQFGDVVINIDNDSLGGNEMLFHLSPGHDTITSNDCNAPLTFPFPVDTFLTFTKQ
ncbi:DUF6705 family protein [Winogradskyella sp. ECml5-4]|uniref:DUF6705 family protein n=1 Tax=Winogradskyella sp. ECml5-4 TaxID=3110975 RepID=UPI002FEE82F0